MRNALRQAELEAGRPPGTVKLLAVSKGQSAEQIRLAYMAGLREFAENYLQEAEKKMAQLKDLSIIWHFSGPVQSNKSQAIARQFSWVHSVDRLKIASLLNQYRPVEWPPLNICLQVNLSGEASKSGLKKAECADLIKALKDFSNLKCRGLMTIGAAGSGEAEQFELFSELRTLMQALNDEYSLEMDTLSMGMSGDFRQAVYAGSTMVRIGRALFGERND